MKRRQVKKQQDKKRVVALCLGDTTYISRFHRNCATLLEMGLELESYSLKPRDQPLCRTLSHHKLIDGWFRKLRHPFFAPFRQMELVLLFVLTVYKSNSTIIFAHNLPALLIGWVVKKLKRGKVKILVYDAMELESARASHTPSFIPFDSKGKWKGDLERFLVHDADLIISADYERTNIMAQLMRRADILTCRNVPYTKKTSKTNLIRETLGLADQSFIVLYQGLIAQGRGIEITLRAVNLLPTNVVFVIMGFGDMSYKKVKGFGCAAKPAIAGLFLPAVQPDKLLDWTASADLIHVILENTNLSYFTAAPNKLYEAAMVGVPVIASHFPEIKRVLQRYPYGFLIDPTSELEIAETIVKIMENPKIQEQYRKIALQGARSELNWEMESKKLKTRLSDLLSV